MTDARGRGRCELCGRRRVLRRVEDLDGELCQGCAMLYEFAQGWALAAAWFRVLRDPEWIARIEGLSTSLAAVLRSADDGPHCGTYVEKRRDIGA